MKTFYLVTRYRCRCMSGAAYVEVDDISRVARFYCEDCYGRLGGEQREIKTVSWLGSCPPFIPDPPQCRLESFRLLDN
jgi:hypothetical protein